MIDGKPKTRMAFAVVVRQIFSKETPLTSATFLAVCPMLRGFVILASQWLRCEERTVGFQKELLAGERSDY